MMIEATDIDYLRTSIINVTTSESSSSSTTNMPSIIGIIDDDIDSIIVQPKQILELSLTPAKDININRSDTQDIDQLLDSNIHDQKVVDLEDNIDLQDETDDLEEVQPKKRRKSTGVKLIEKGKKVEKSRRK
jgi:hypothetical protein